MFLFFLSSGMFLGWSLGANDAANVFGTAVGTRMLRFRTATILCSVFVILGAVISGSGTSRTLSQLGEINAVAGAFVVAFAAGLSIYLMVRSHWPVSTSQAVVGAIIGWNLFSSSPTNTKILIEIMATWVACPILSGIIAIISYKVITFLIFRFNVHMFKLDNLTRYGLIMVGIMGSFALGANNIANVVGMFLPVTPFEDIRVFGWLRFTSAQQLFLLGSLAISVGVLTFSKKAMDTIGKGIFKLSPVMALVAVWSHSVVLILFSSQRLAHIINSVGLPSFPLVPVSSTQAIVGAVVGMGLLKGPHNIRWKTVGGIAGSWVTTPLLAGILSFILLFILQNVFLQTVCLPL